MTDPRKPEGSADPLDEAYRQAGAADPSRPSERTRAAILAHARAQAAAVRAPAGERFDTTRPAANDRYWWRSAAAGVAVAVLALMIWAPRYESRHETGGSAPSASREAAPPATAAAVEAPAAAPAAEPPPASLDSAADAPAGPRFARRPPAAPAPLGTAPREVAAPTRAPPPSDALSGASTANEAPAVVTDAGAAAASPTAAATPAAAAPARVAGGAPTAEAERSQEIVVTGARATTARLAAIAPAAASRAAPAPAADDKRLQEVVVTRPSAPPAAKASASGLGAAIGRGDLERVRDLIARPGALEARDAEGRTPLVQAVLAGQLGIVRALLDAGADPNAAGPGGASPRALALGVQRSDIADLLAERGGR